MSESSLSRDKDGGERRPGFRAAGASLPRIVAPIVARHGGGVLARLKADWAAIIGPELAMSTWPEALSRDGVLRLRVASVKALEVQHRAPLLVERTNLFFGRVAVSRLALVQGPLPLPNAAPPRETARPIAAGEAAALGQQLAEIVDPELREALDRLGRTVVESER